MCRDGEVMAVTKPAVVWIGTNGNNLWKGRGLHKLAIVLHIAEGSMAGIDSWFSNPAAQASSNYAVGLDGAIHEYVDPEGLDAPFANGAVAAPDAEAQALIARAGGQNLNWVTVSIEHAGRSGDVLTPAQFAASTQLAAWLCGRFGIPADSPHLLGHGQIDSVTRARCPGWNATQWDQYVAAVAAIVTPPAPVDPCAEKDAEIAQLTAKLNAAAQLLQQRTNMINAVKAALGV
jgi:N-acetylmuramoyl-L-alanine amidase